MTTQLEKFRRTNKTLSEPPPQTVEKTQTPKKEDPNQQKNLKEVPKTTKTAPRWAPKIL